MWSTALLQNTGLYNKITSCVRKGREKGRGIISEERRSGQLFKGKNEEGKREMQKDRENVYNNPKRKITSKKKLKINKQQSRERERERKTYNRMEKERMQEGRKKVNNSYKQ